MKRSLRKRGWDYSESASYLVTICLDKKSDRFGNVKMGKMILNSLGEIAEERLLATPDFFPNVVIHSHVIMPDHVHAVISMHRVTDKHSSGTGKFKKQSGTLGSVIRSYKSAVTSRAKNITSSFKWQDRYDDQILLNQTAIDNACRYVLENPMNHR